MKSLRGRVALLTGASRGIGRYIGRALAREGMHVALAARSAVDLDEAARELAAFNVRTLAVAGDISDPSARERLVQCTEAEFGAIDVLVNNAGVEQVVAFAHQAPDDVTRILTTNLEAPLLLSMRVLQGMLDRRSGHIVTVSSMAGHRGGAYQAAYSASKAGLIEWTGSLRVELEGSGVSASVVCPGLVSQVGMWARHGLSAPRLARESTPEQVGRAVVRALQRDIQEMNVNPFPVWPLLVVRTLFPELANAIVKRLGLVEVARRVAEGRDR